MSKTLSLRKLLSDQRQLNSKKNCWKTPANYDALEVPVNLKKENYQQTSLNL